mgnify:CR=1 FL=1
MPTAIEWSAAAGRMPTSTGPGVTGLATALIDAVARERGEVTYQLMAGDLDTSPLPAEMIPQALRPVVHEHYDIKQAGASLNILDIDES